ncbi:Rod shape-determining protein MreD [Reichenbachiella sp. MALMAid0571]|uniref:Rod shape-determining protein MreD n=1 Tax=Reichenbachiella sp. MALMAid0571 TaxID=3143939 RepID=UPI0032DEAE8D
MNKYGTAGFFVLSLIIILAQVFIFKDLILFGSAFCFFYVLIFFLLPIDTNPLMQIFFGFVVGLLIDTFYNTQGVHASAATFLMFVRPFWLNILSPGSGYGAADRINIRTQGFQWFLTFTYPLILIHCILLFFVEAYSFTNFWTTLAKGFYSSLFTLIVVLIIHYLFINKEK